MNQNITGSCLCGSVRFALRPPFSAFRYCHCTRCRKASGSAHAANLLVPESGFEWLHGEASVKRFDMPGTERFSVWFCPTCGSRAPHRIRTRDDILIPAGLLDADPEMLPQNNIFWDSRASWYVEPQQMPRFSEYS